MPRKSKISRPQYFGDGPDGADPLRPAGEGKQNADPTSVQGAVVSDNPPAPNADIAPTPNNGSRLAMQLKQHMPSKAPSVPQEAPKSGRQPTAEQTAIMAAAKALGGSGVLVVEAGAGCLAADTILNVNRAGKSSQMSIEKLVKQFNGIGATYTRSDNGATARMRAWDLTIPTRIARAVGDVIMLGTVKKAWYSGKKQTYILKTISGNAIRATSEHPFLLGNGEWCNLGNIRIGDILQVNSGRGKPEGSSGFNKQYHSADTKFHPYQIHRGRDRYSVPVHHLVIESVWNDLPFHDYLFYLRTDRKKSGSFRYLEPSQIVHHKNEDPTDNRVGNLEVLDSVKEHSNRHNWGNNVLWQVGQDKVASITPFEIEDTYDVEMVADPHNFLANGFVVHNTGKTTTLTMLEETLGGRGQYTAFNSSLVAESKKKFRKAQCNTTHSLAFQAVGRKFAHRLGGQRVRSDQVARMLGIEDMVLTLTLSKDETKARTLSAGFLAGQVTGAIRRFCQSADPEITGSHFRYLDGIDFPEDGKRTYTNNNLVREYLLPFARKAWQDLSNPDGQLPYNPDCYMKSWELDNPIISADYLLVDEDQDSAAVFLSVIKKQKNMLIILVGDENQCQPVGTKVTVVKSYRRGNRFTGCLPTVYREVAIENLKEGDMVASYDISRSFFRRTGSKVERVVSREYDGSLISITMVSGETTLCTPDHRCVVRVGDAFNDKWLVYLMRRGQSFRIGMVKGMYESQLGDLGLPMRMRAEGADSAWILSVCTTEDQARLEEACISWAWGIPSLRFRQSSGRGISQESLDEFWGLMDGLEDKAVELLAASGRDIKYPLCTRDTSIYRNRGFLIQAYNLVDGMMMLTMKGALDANGKRAVKNNWAEITISQQYYSGLVYSLKVARDETYVSDGVITHNSIYEWRGSVNAAAAFPDAPRQYLSQSFRFGPAIADLANRVLAELEEPTQLRLKGLESIPSCIEPLADPTCILCRTNGAAIQHLLSALQSGKRPFLVGGGSDVIAFVEGAKALQEGRSTGHADLACFGSWGEVQEYSKADEGEDLRLMVRLIDNFGAATILTALSNMPTEENADLVISTAHKSKGREWDRVKLAQDFPVRSKACDSDLKLLYVALTRAKLILDVSECPFFTGEDALPFEATIPVRTEPDSIVPPAPSTPPAPTTFTWSKGKDGSWLARGPQGKLGERVEIVKKDGSSAAKTLISIVWEGQGVALYKVR